MTTTRPHIVILGGGFAGLAAARALRLALPRTTVTVLEQRPGAEVDAGTGLVLASPPDATRALCPAAISTLPRSFVSETLPSNTATNTPAVIAAIHDATGAWIHDLPASSERVLAALTGAPLPAPPGVSAPSASRGAS